MSTFVQSRFVLGVCALGLCVFALACGSTRSGGDDSAPSRPAKTGVALRVRYLAYASGQKLELVNDSHSDRTEVYSSTKRLEDAFVKVTPDEVLDETVANFAKNGFFEKATPGSAPLEAAAGVSQALEVEKGGTTSFWAITKTANESDRKRFLECAQLFAFVYNNTYQLQSVERAPDWDSQNAALKKKRSK
ncbi:MAG: hypothetical protein SGI72_07420 [Planctomycetota bacterium]|nr:hypothetical protein [Planctomycetota bacterium]